MAGTPAGIVCVDVPANGGNGAKLEAGAQAPVTISAVYTKLQVKIIPKSAVRLLLRKLEAGTQAPVWRTGACHGLGFFFVFQGADPGSSMH